VAREFAIERSEHISKHRVPQSGGISARGPSRQISHHNIMSALGGTAEVAGARSKCRLGLNRRSCLIHFACRGGYQASDFIHWT
jgi:hypothetical protein